MCEWTIWNATSDSIDGPLPYYQYCEIKMADGEVWGDEPAGNYNWSKTGCAGEIVAYRVPKHLAIPVDDEVVLEMAN